MMALPPSLGAIGKGRTRVVVVVVVVVEVINGPLGQTRLYAWMIVRRSGAYGVGIKGTL